MGARSADCVLSSRAAYPLSALASSIYNLPRGRKSANPPANGSRLRILPPRGRAVDSRTQQTADLLGLTQYRKGDSRRARGTAAQYGIDVSGVGHQSSHLIADSPQGLYSDFGQRFFELRKVLPGESRERVFTRKP